MSDSAAPNPQHLHDLLDAILNEARARGASAAEASVNIGQALSVGVRLAQVENLVHQQSQGLAVTVYFGGRKGHASTADWSLAAVRDTVAAACAIAQYTAADPYAGLADPELLAQHILDLELNHPWNVTPEVAIELARECEQSARDFDTRIKNSDGAGVSTQQGMFLYGNSHGFRGGYSSTRHSVSCAVIASDDSGMQHGGWSSSARSADELDDVQSIGRQAAQRAVQRLGGRRLPTGKVPVLFTPQQARGLIGSFVSAISGGSLYRRTSFLVDSAGRQVFSPLLHIREDPHLLRGVASSPFDAEGVATRARDLVSAGVVQGYVLNSYAARRLGLRTTGNAGGTYNLLVRPGELDYSALLREMGRGLVVTHLMGHGTNLLTGDYSRGAAGFWVENGEIAYPVEEITIAGRLQQMFMGIQAVGADIEQRTSVHCPSVLIDSMMVAGH